MRDHGIDYIGGHEVVFDPVDTLIRVRYIGRVTYENLRIFAEEIYTHPQYNQYWDILINMGEAKFDLSFTDLFHYANAISKDPRRVLGATAIVSPSMLHYGLGRMYAGTVGDRLGKLRIERTEAPALAWLKEQRRTSPGN
jgi:hypothetical protein